MTKFSEMLVGKKFRDIDKICVKIHGIKYEHWNHMVPANSVIVGGSPDIGSLLYYDNDIMVDEMLEITNT